MNEADRPLKKVTFNLFKEDVEYLQKAYGQGWTGQARSVIEQFVTERKRLHSQINAGFNTNG